MKILVIDVAAQVGGAVTILEQFIEEFKKDKENHYYVVLSVITYANTDNITFINCAWVKKSLIHRLYFDEIYIKNIIGKIKPDRILSLQNKTVAVKHIPQTVYYHNVLPISNKRFSYQESKELWFYQNAIGSIVKWSLNRADSIIVQAGWIKKQLSDRWGINERIIKVKPPVFDVEEVAPTIPDIAGLVLFYPANAAIYKNHQNLLLACKEIWKEYRSSFTLVLTGALDDFNKSCQDIIRDNIENIRLVGRLNKSQMLGYYKISTLIFPSYLETIGLPLIEAKESGSRILVSDCEYAHETLSDYQDVLFFDPFDINDIKAKILEGLIIKKDCTNGNSI